MTLDKTRNVGHSVFERLLTLAKKSKDDFNTVLSRYGIERFLYRLSISSYADRFILKGASLFLVWQGQNYRVTKDADLLGMETYDEATLAKISKEICLVSVPEDDGITFLPDTVAAEIIREDQPYGGIRITLK